ncbi:arginase family protein [Promethearchaeum syntrophicum]|uniref:Arginase family protein n=1 Tax=Promethearchaeum syntrophicum TaxID=2594042 RepID=A0A5B9DD32_9ARCH|nr:arginase family protein [Candidatus Prometheoarchaeum syntrophicum]QEE16905.1 agmatinase [Candidatus Prometheoarchaeum syntrophicum]
MLPSTFYDFPIGDLDKSFRFAIIGIPWDGNSTHVIGNTRNAPSELRTLTTFLGRATENGNNIMDFNAVDFGDVSVYPSLPDLTRDNISIMIKELIPWNKPYPIPIMIGGDHYCSYPVIKALNEKRSELKQEKFGVLIFDAHLDYYDKWLDVEEHFHCTVSKRISEIPNISAENMAIVGVRDLDTIEIEEAKKDNLFFIPSYKFSPKGASSGIEEQVVTIINHFRKQKISHLYISIDIDSIDGALAPGTPYAIPGGFKYRELWYMLQKIIEQFEIVGLDVVEVAPDLDTSSKITQITAIKLITELMGFITQKIK